MPDFLPPNWLPALVVFLAVGMAVVSLAFLTESLREVRRRRDFRRQLEAVAGRTKSAMRCSAPRCCVTGPRTRDLTPY